MHIARLDKQIEAKQEAMRRMTQQHRADLLEIAHRHKVLAESVSNYHHLIKREMDGWQIEARAGPGRRHTTRH